MSEYAEVGEPIQNSPFEKPTRYWYIREGEQPELRPSAPEHPKRRPAMIFPPKDQRDTWTTDGTILRPSKDFPYGFELGLVNLVRERLEGWQQAGYPGVTRTTLELIQWWTRYDRAGISGVLQHLAVDSSTANASRTRREKRQRKA